jgi:hypothetical protein
MVLSLKTWKSRSLPGLQRTDTLHRGEKFVSLAQLPLDEAIMVDDGRREAFEAAYNAIESRRLFCLKCVAELERQSSSV